MNMFTSTPGGMLETEANPIDQETCEMVSEATARRLSNMMAAPRFQAKTKAGKSCRSAAVKGKRVCFVHGGASPGAPKGRANGSWKHGGWTDEAVALRRAAIRLLKAVETV